MPAKFGPTSIRSAALLMLLVGAIGSVMLTIRAGQHNRSFLLIILFLGWVLAPFAGLFLAHRRFKNWPDNAGRLLSLLMVILAIGSLLAYTGLLNPPGVKNAFIFLVFPVLSWMIILIVILLGRKSSHGEHGTGQGPDK